MTDHLLLADGTSYLLLASGTSSLLLEGDSYVSLGSLCPEIRIEVDATTDPTAALRAWTDITPLIRQISWTRSGRNMELNRSTAGTLSAVCDDRGGAVTGLGLRKRQWVRVLAFWNGVVYPRWQGVLETLPRKWPGQGADQLVEFHAADVFKVLGLTDLAGHTFPAQRNDQRVSAILALAHLTAGSIDSDTDDADAVTAPFATGSMALDYLLQVEGSENGVLVANPDGTVDFQGRHWRFRNSLTSSGTFGEFSTDIPYFDDVEFDDDDSLIANVINVTPFGAEAPVTVTNTASAAKNWPTSLDRQLLSSSTGLALDAAQWLANRYGDPSPRIPQIRIELPAVARQTGGTALVTTLLGANNSDRFTWDRQASTPISDDVYVEQISETVDVKGGSWEMSFQLSPAADDVSWLAGDAVYGLAGVTTRGGY